VTSSFYDGTGIAHTLRPRDRYGKTSSYRDRYCERNDTFLCARQLRPRRDSFSWRDLHPYNVVVAGEFLDLARQSVKKMPAKRQSRVKSPPGRVFFATAMVRAFGIAGTAWRSGVEVVGNGGSSRCVLRRCLSAYDGCAKLRVRCGSSGSCRPSAWRNECLARRLGTPDEMRLFFGPCRPSRDRHVPRGPVFRWSKHW